MHRHHPRHALALALMLAVAAGCSQEAPTPAASSTTPPAQAPAAPTPPAITDEAGLRAAAAKALAEQRIYTPAGDNAIEHYLALRSLKPDDGALAIALLELLPYALIGSEQALARGDLGEARRLLDIVERADPQAPALTRLRDSLVAAEAAAVQRAEAEAQALAAREAQALADAEAARTAAATQAAAPPPTAPTATQPAQATTTASPAITTPAPATAGPAPAAAPPTPPPAPQTAAAAPAPAPTASAPAARAAIPRLLSAPSPRYPLMAQRRKLEGDVTVEFTIQPDGSVAAPRVVSTTSPGQFEEAALVAASRWRFETGPAPVKTTRVVQFRLPRS
ncbi:energy transducer TonB [Arenimonas sp. MALMAid1274]|uniref:energy transducer TonB n=1 Tax=Arenimonas sp. MALMAid1274 TaxID=3411630 RepID=UPI003BA21400